MKSTKSGGGWAALGRPVTARLGMTPGPVPFSSHVGKADRIEQPDHPASDDAGASLCRIYLDAQPGQCHCCCGGEKRKRNGAVDTSAADEAWANSMFGKC